MERDETVAGQGSKSGYFNSHAHVERDATAKLSSDKQRHFNSHAHVERDERKIRAMQVWRISTHTLTWSVTGVKNMERSEIDISTHTLTWSVTR